jgi:hypothetical protein
MKLKTCLTLLGALLSSAAFANKIAVVIALPSQYSTGTLGVTAFGNMSGALLQGEVRADQDVGSVVLDYLEKSGHEAFELKLPEAALAKVAKRKFLGGWSGHAFSKSSKAWLFPHAKDSGADTLLLVTTFPSGANMGGGGAFEGFGIHTRKGAFGAEDWTTLYAHIGIVAISVSDWRLLGGTYDAPCWSSVTELPQQFDAITGKNPLLAKVRAVAKAGAEIQMQYVLDAAKLNRFGNSGECGTPTGAPLLFEAIKRYE